jgi:hypothetical protein
MNNAVKKMLRTISFPPSFSFFQQVAEKCPSAAFPSSFVVAAYSQVRLTPQDFGSLASAPF